MGRTRKMQVRIQAVELEGVRYAIIPEDELRELCERAGAELTGAPPAEEEQEAADLGMLNAPDLCRHLAERRRQAGMSQTELARRSGVRVETVNRIERGRTTPNFGTMRNLLFAIRMAERELGV